MSNQLAVLPEAGSVPAYFTGSTINDEAIANVQVGYPPSLRMTNTGRFKMVSSDGTDMILGAKDLAEGVTEGERDSLHGVVVRAKADLVKAFYATKFDPNKEAQPPDCFSSDGKRPDLSSPNPQCDTCAMCKLNAFGSGTNAAGEASKGKACSDNKILAYYWKGGLYEVKIPPASLKIWGRYAKDLETRNIPVNGVLTLVHIDLEGSFPALVFNFGGF